MTIPCTLLPAAPPRRGEGADRPRAAAGHGSARAALLRHPDPLPAHTRGRRQDLQRGGVQGDNSGNSIQYLPIQQFSIE